MPLSNLHTAPYLEKPTLKWSGNDSIAMEFIYQALPYLNNEKHKEALVLYKHVCTMEHSLPGIFLTTGELYGMLGDTLQAKTYYQREVEHDLKFIDLKHPREHEFGVALCESYIALHEEEKARIIAKKYRMKNFTLN